jgi:phytoene dehydrogenase-like protein
VELYQLGARAIPTVFRHWSRYTPRWVPDAFRSVQELIPSEDRTLKLFLDAQLLISAQTTSEHANALYAAAALDLPRRGVAHVQGGMGSLAETLVDAIRQHGGKVVYRHQVTGLKILENGDYLLETNKSARYQAQTIIANLTPWNIAELLAGKAPKRYRNLGPLPEDSWGAMMVYVGLEDNPLINKLPIHQQVITRTPLAEGNSIFLSLSPDWDPSRAPEGHRALTISTHTRLHDWWHDYEHDRDAYEARKQAYVDQILEAAEVALPGLRSGAKLILPGTPVTFQRFTRRIKGWVGGFPQINLFQAWPARVRPGLWMVGDSIFPGQSTPAVSLGGLRVAEAILHQDTDTVRTIYVPDRTATSDQPLLEPDSSVTIKQTNTNTSTKQVRELSGIERKQ